MKIRAVVFDLDGTLIDSMGIWLDVDKEFLSKRGIYPPQNLFEDIEGGNSFVEMAVYFKKKFNLSESINEIMQEWTQMVFEHYKNKVKLKSGVKEFLKFLKEKNIKMAVGTSNSDYLTKTVLFSNQISEYFSEIITGDETVRGKPFPDIFLKAINKMGTQPTDAIVIEDTLNGVLAAKNAGIKVCAVYDKHSQKKLETIKEISDWFVYDFYELKSLFEGIL